MIRIVVAALLIAGLNPAMAQNFPAPKYQPVDTWTDAEKAQAKRSQDAPFVDPYFHGYHDTRPCLTTGQPEDCHGYVVGPYGAVVPSGKQ